MPKRQCCSRPNSKNLRATLDFAKRSPCVLLLGEIDAIAILPSMRTDIVLNHAESQSRIVIDTKFTSLLSGEWYRKESIRNGYLYQIYAYLRSQETNDDPMTENASGLLLHPCIGNSINESVVIQNHKIKFATVDLSAPATDIRERLLEIISECNI